MKKYNVNKQQRKQNFVASENELSNHANLRGQIDIFECSMKERYNTSKVIKQRKLIWNFKFYTDTAAIFSQMNEAFRVKRFVETSK